MDNPDRRTLAFAAAVVHGHCTPGFAMAALARGTGTEGPAAAVLGPLWDTLDEGARKKLESALLVASSDPAAARAMIAESGLDQEAVPGSLPAFAATIRPASTVRLPASRAAATAHVSDSSRFEIRHEHARGGMGRILIAWDARLGREVALKELLPGMADTVAADGGSGVEPSDRERFFREARVTGQLEHPNIVPVYEMGERDQAPFYAMRLIRGDTMAARLEKIAKEEKDPERRLDARLRMLDPMLDVCDAVAYAHSRGVVNRDLKPANIMLGNFGETFVLDWGLARVKGQEDRALPELSRAAASLRKAVDAPGSQNLTIAGSVLGTPAYMAPEQARGEIESVDERSDIYSLGAILYEILTGRPPFEAPSLLAVLQAVIRGDAFPATKAEPLAPRDLAAIAHRALERDPERRYPTVRALGEDLRNCRDGRPLTVYRYGMGEQLGRFVRRNRALALSLAAAMLILIAGAAIALHLARVASSESVLARKAENEARAAELETARRAEGEKRALADTRTALGHAEGLRLAATSLTVAQESPGVAFALALEASDRAPGAASNNALLSVLLDLRERHLLVGHGSLVKRAAWSPSGARVATGSTDNSIILWDAASGAILRRLEGHRAQILSLSFSPDGARILSGGADSTARVWDVENGVEILRMGVPEKGDVEAAFDPRGAAVLTWRDACAVWSVPGGKRLPLEGGEGEVVRGAWSPDGARVALVQKDGRAGIWEAASGRRERMVDGGSPVVSLEFSPDARAAVIAWKSGKLAVIELATGAERFSISVPQGLSDALFTDAGRTIATVDSESHLRLLDAMTGAVTSAAIRGHFSLRDGLSADGRRVLKVDGPRVQVLDTKSGAVLARLIGHEAEVNWAALDRDGRRVATGANDFTAALWDLEFASPIPRSEIPDGADVVAVDGERSSALVRDPAGVLSWAGAEGLSAAGAALQLPGRFLTAAAHELGLWGGAKGVRARVLDLRAGAELIPSPELAGIFPLAISADTPVIVCMSGAPDDASPPDYLTVDVRTWKILGRAPNGTSSRQVLPAADGQRILILDTQHGECQLVDMSSGKVERTLIGHSGTLMSAVFLPGDRVAITIAADASVRRWDLATGKTEARHELPRIMGGSLVRSADGKLVALVTTEWVRVLDATTLREVFTIPAIKPGAVAFSRDGSRICVPDGQGSLLRVPIDLAKFAHEIAPRKIRSRDVIRYEIGDPEWRKTTIEALDRENVRGLRATIRAQLALKEDRLEDALHWSRRAIETSPTYPDSWGIYFYALMTVPESRRDMKEILRAIREYNNRGVQGTDDLFKFPETAPLKELPEVQELLRSLK